MGILHPMQKGAPGKKLYPATKKMICKNMKKISLQDVPTSLEELSGEVKVPEEIRIPALKAVQAIQVLAHLVCFPCPRAVYLIRHPHWHAEICQGQSNMPPTRVFVIARPSVDGRWGMQPRT